MICAHRQVDLINDHEMTVLLKLWKSILTEICSSTFQIRQVSSFSKYTLELQGWITRVEIKNIFSQTMASVILRGFLQLLILIVLIKKIKISVSSETAVL